MAVKITNFTENKVSSDWVKKIVALVLQGEKQKETTDVSIAFLGPGRMRKLNKQFRSKNTTTDVLAFCEKEVAFEKFKIGALKKHSELGEIVICLREVKKNAKKQNTPFEKELAFVLIHGLLHLLGYDHEKSEKELAIMEKKQTLYLNSL